MHLLTQKDQRPCGGRGCEALDKHLEGTVTRWWLSLSTTMVLALRMEAECVLTNYNNHVIKYNVLILIRNVTPEIPFRCRKKHEYTFIRINQQCLITPIPSSFITITTINNTTTKVNNKHHQGIANIRLGIAFSILLCLAESPSNVPTGDLSLVI